LGEHLHCPRCGGLSWLEYQDPDLVQRCLCGLRRYLRRSVDGLTVMTAAVPQESARLPAKNTKIYRCLLAVVNSWPHTIMTLEIASASSLNGKETSALMAVLSARGLVERLEERRGLIGGSIWRLTKSAAALMRLEKE
jgi:hypothetical protein